MRRAGFFHTTHRIVHGRRHQVLEHVFVIFEQGWIDLHAFDIVFAIHGHFDQTRARLPFNFDLSQLILRHFHVILHLLGLLHQAGQLVFHHDAFPLNSMSC